MLHVAFWGSEEISNTKKVSSKTEDLVGYSQSVGWGKFSRLRKQWISGKAGELKVVQHGWKVNFKGNLQISQQKATGTQIGQEFVKQQFGREKKNHSPIIHFSCTSNLSWEVV